MQKEITQNEENFIKIIDVFFGADRLFFMPSSKVYADELNCIVTVNVNDVLGEYNDNIVIYLQTANEEQKKEYSNGI